jgi:Mn2+/Fe2+ NRAMP family transporter
VPSDLRSRNWLRYLKFYGPGAIIASVTIGTGETVFAARGGAIFGYALIWCFTLGALLKCVQVYSGLRVITLTGIHPVRYWAQMRGPRAWFPILLGIVAVFIIPPMYSALPKALATLLTQLIHLSPETLRYGVQLNIVSSLILVFCALLAAWSSYRILELVQTGIVVLFLAFVVAAVVALRPDLWVLLKNMVVVSFPDYPEWVREGYPTIAARPNWVEVMTYIGFIGGSSSDYIGYLSFLREKKWGLAGRRTESTAALNDPVPDSDGEHAKGKLWLRAPLTDALVSFSFIAIFAIIFLVLGAMVLSPAHLVPHASELLTVQARFLTGLHPGLTALYLLGIVTVFLGTIYGGIELQSRALYECGRVVLPQLKETPLRKFRLFVVGFAIGSGLLLIWTNWDPVALFTPASIVGGVLACGFWCFAMLWLDKKFLPKAYRMNRVFSFLLFVSGIVLTSFAVRSIYDFIVSIV